jgi:L-asparagine transporter-like permease
MLSAYYMPPRQSGSNTLQISCFVSLAQHVTVPAAAVLLVVMVLAAAAAAAEATCFCWQTWHVTGAASHCPLKSRAAA